MITDKFKYGKIFLKLALISLIIGLTGGALGSITYIFPDFLIDFQGLSKLRPVHVSYVMFWIIIAATGGIYLGLSTLSNTKPIRNIAKIQFVLWIISLTGIGYSYFVGDFGGREYWEFNPIWALPIALSWILFLINFVYLAKKIKNWPVYVWMWMTGIIFFLFIFIENYLWLIPYFREHFVTDMTIQWKVAGSIVGAINQMTYGIAFFLMDKITGNIGSKVGRSKLAFAVYFLGLFNLMFNWGHHIYPVPTADYIRYIGYAVSMTEWILFLRIIYNWRKDIQEIKKNYHFFPYRFIMASNFWVFVNLGIACLMSIPVLNMYVHGTHFIVAHSMGTTIGINTMILFAAVFMFLMPETPQKGKSSLKIAFWIIQTSLFLFFMSLNIAGLIKGFWLNTHDRQPFAFMMNDLKPYFVLFAISGAVLMLAFLYLTITIFTKKKQVYKEIP